MHLENDIRVGVMPRGIARAATILFCSLVGAGCEAPPPAPPASTTESGPADIRDAQDPLATIAALQGFIDSEPDLLPATYEIDDFYVSPKISEFNNGTFDFRAARLASASLAMEAFTHGLKVRAIPAEMVMKEVALFQDSGFIKCRGTVSRDTPLVARAGSDGQPVLELEVKVAIKDITEAVPSLEYSPFARGLGFLIKNAHPGERPLTYRAAVAISPLGDHFQIESHNMAGSPLTAAALKEIIRRNVMVMFSLKAVASMKQAGVMAMTGHRDTRHFTTEARAANKKAESRKLLGDAAESLRNATKGFLTAIPPRLAATRIYVSLSPEISTQIRHCAVDPCVFHAVTEAWSRRACRVRTQPGYSARELAQEAGAVLREFGVASVLCDLAISPAIESYSPDRVRLTVKYDVVSVGSQRPPASASWVAAAAWAALPGPGELELEFPAKQVGADSWRLGHALPAGTVFGRIEPVLAWGEPADILSIPAITNAASSAIATKLAGRCAESLDELLGSPVASRIEKKGTIFGGIACLPEIAPQEDGIDLSLLRQIAGETATGDYWIEVLPQASELQRAGIVESLEKLLPTLKPRKWKSRLNERLVAEPAFLSESHVALDFGGESPRVTVERTAFDESGLRLLERIQQLAVDCVRLINEAATGSDDSETIERTWNTLVAAVRATMGHKPEDPMKAIQLLQSLGDAKKSVVAREFAFLVGRQAAETALSGGGRDEVLLVAKALFQEGLSEQDLFPGSAAFAECLVQLGEPERGVAILETVLKQPAEESNLQDILRAGVVYSRILLNRGESYRAKGVLEDSIDAYRAVRGAHALLPVSLLKELSVAGPGGPLRALSEDIASDVRLTMFLTHGELSPEAAVSESPRPTTTATPDPVEESD